MVTRREIYVVQSNPNTIPKCQWHHVQDKKIIIPIASIWKYICLFVCLYNKFQFRHYMDRVEEKKRLKEKEREEGSLLGHKIWSKVKEHHTLSRFIRILKLSLELTYLVITTEFERSSNMSPNSWNKLKRIFKEKINKYSYRYLHKFLSCQMQLQH